MYLSKLATKMADSPSIDAFARSRVSEPFSIFDSKQIFDNAPLVFDEQLTGGATSTYEQLHARSRLDVVSGTDSAIRQTFMRFNYQPGKSQLVFLTGLCPKQANTRKRIGLFTENDGIFFEDDGVDSKWVIRKNLVDGESFTQANWNLDTMDGSGGASNPSGINLNLDNTQIWVIDYEWLGVGRVRVGFVFDGIPMYVHEFNHANNIPTVYMATPNLPVRYELTSTGGAGTLHHICSSVISEGGIQDNGVLRSADRGVNGIAVTSGNIQPIIAIRLKSTHKGLTINPLGVSAMSTTGANFRWTVATMPTINGTLPSWTQLDNSGVEYMANFTSANLITPGVNEGIVNSSGYVSNNQDQISSILNSAQRPGSYIDGTMQMIVFSIQPTANETFYGGMTWRELV